MCRRGHGSPSGEGGRRGAFKIAEPFWRTSCYAGGHPSSLSQEAQAFKSYRIQFRRSGLLDASTSAGRISCGVSESLFTCFRSSGFYCSAGCFSRVAKQWNLGKGQSWRRRDAETLEGGTMQGPPSVQPLCGAEGIQLHERGTGGPPVSVDVHNEGALPALGIQRLKQSLLLPQWQLAPRTRA